MKENLKKGIENIIPFLILGIAIAFLVGIFIMFSYVLFWGLIVGAVLWGFNFLKTLIFPERKSSNIPAEKKGRIIEHEDQK